MKRLKKKSNNKSHHYSEEEKIPRKLKKSGINYFKIEEKRIVHQPPSSFQ